MSASRDASPVRKDLTKKENNPWPACASGCSDDVIASDCDFSEDGAMDIHHCVDCREKAWAEKGANCDCCGDFWCMDWQSAFVWLEQCDCDDSWDARGQFAESNDVANSELYHVCPTCFIKTGIRCLNPSCACSVQSLLKQDMELFEEKGAHRWNKRLLEALRTIKE